jgi:hypothetical protein
MGVFYVSDTLFFALDGRGQIQVGNQFARIDFYSDYSHIPVRCIKDEE